MKFIAVKASRQKKAPSVWRRGRGGFYLGLWQSEQVSLVRPAWLVGIGRAPPIPVRWHNRQSARPSRVCGIAGPFTGVSVPTGDTGAGADVVAGGTGAVVAGLETGGAVVVVTAGAGVVTAGAGVPPLHPAKTNTMTTNRSVVINSRYSFFMSFHSCVWSSISLT